ncbi:DUF5996 family protein [Roseivivax marinus]|uniref:DUF5996 family protein n=1 Tax=Roseivivax marinus TaxID=1379903 RepID=UPI0035123D07
MLRCGTPDLSEFFLSCEALRKASDPAATHMAVLQSTYDAAEELAKCDREALDCGLKAHGVPHGVEGAWGQR